MGTLPEVTSEDKGSKKSRDESRLFTPDQRSLHREMQPHHHGLVLLVFLAESRVVVDESGE